MRYLKTAGFNEDHSVGAAVMMAFVMDLFTLSEKKSFTPAEIVNVLDKIAKRELPEVMLDMIKDVADNHDPR